MIVTICNTDYEHMMIRNKILHDGLGISYTTIKYNKQIL